MSDPVLTPSRRNLLVGALGLASPVLFGDLASRPAWADPATPRGVYTPTFFTGPEWRVLNALVDRLIPADEMGPGALEAGVTEFVDRQMNEPYGHGSIWYLEGPYREAPPELGYQLGLTPRDLYHHALPEIDRQARAKHGRQVADLDAPTRDALLQSLQHDELRLGDVPSGTFFGQLLQNTREGYFCDPGYGGNRQMAAWRMIGFPGARADFMDWVEQYGRHYPYPPVSIRYR
ncbi:MAG: gluconate 2-dehydrogenase [Azospirillum brasilense]|nr:MAG: gluconate 2-dehydrogenase [Azospirillum brasilense]